MSEEHLDITGIIRTLDELDEPVTPLALMLECYTRYEVSYNAFLYNMPQLLTLGIIKQEAGEPYNLSLPHPLPEKFYPEPYHPDDVDQEQEYEPLEGDVMSYVDDNPYIDGDPFS